MKWEPEGANPDYGSFMPGLEWAVQKTTGPILELGAGYFSTPYLHALQRTIITYEYDPDFADQVEALFGGEGHWVISTFDEVPDIPFSVVLLDCEGWSRQKFFDRVRARTEVFVVHDTQDPWVKWEPFKYQHSFGENPRTTLLSETLDVAVCGI